MFSWGMLTGAGIYGSSYSDCRLAYSNRGIETGIEATDGGTMHICLRLDDNETRTDVDSHGALVTAQPFVGHALREFPESQNTFYA